MKRVRVSELVPGMTTAEDVYSFSNQLVVEKGTELTDKIIARLEYYSVLSIRIAEQGESVEDSSTDEFGIDLSALESMLGTKPEAGESDGKTVSIFNPPVVDTDSSTEGALSFSDTPADMPYSSRIKATKQFKEFEHSFVNNTEALKGNLNDIIKSNSVNTDVMLQSVSDLISKSTTSLGMFDMLHNMRNYDDYTYVHSMSVSLICNIFGHWLNMKDSDIEVLTLAGLLHDIGKLLVPDSIIKKPGKLTHDEYNKVKTHTLEGYKILKKLPIDQRIAEAALLHHERCDGTGYPLSRGGRDIPDFAKIISIADVYDAMTAARVYRGPMCPFKVVSIFEQEGLQKYDSRYILTFLENIGQTYLNNRVRLSDGREGDVMMIHKTCISRPLIKLLDGTFIDLVDERDLFIDALI